MKIIITRYRIDKKRGDVNFQATVDGKKKNWTIALGLFNVLLELRDVENTATNGEQP